MRQLLINTEEALVNDYLFLNYHLLKMLDYGFQRLLSVTIITTIWWN